MKTKERKGKEKEMNNKNLGKKVNLKENKAITLIALVVTIVVLLILAGISLNLVLGQNGIITRAQEAKTKTEADSANTEAQLASLEKEMKKSLGEVSVEITDASGNTVELTKENVTEYMGKVVTNYHPKDSTVTTTTANYSGTSTFNVGTTYRLYYVDFDGKYGEKGGIYLKADVPTASTKSYTLSITSTATADTDTVKIRQLNPSLYATGVTAPKSTYNNMKAVTWLLDSAEWVGLKNSIDEEQQSQVNYVVGAPSLEMMVDSYNTYYGLSSKTMDTTTLSATPTNANRPKLFYQYPTTVDSNNCGYEVGPSTNNSAKNGYYYWTKDYSVASDTDINSMYYPGSSNYYWLASPSANASNGVMYVGYGGGGGLSSRSYNTSGAFCPLVSLKSDTPITLK